jgi:hypothetical protein
VNFYRNSTRRKFLEFCFKFLFEYGEVSIRRVVPYLKLFPSIFYLKFLEHGKAPFLSVKVWGKFESVWNKFDSVWKPNRAHCAAGPTCQRRADPPHRTTLRRTQPLTTGPPSRPGPPISRPDPAAIHYRAATSPPVGTAAGLLPLDAAAPL